MTAPLPLRTRTISQILVLLLAAMGAWLGTGCDSGGAQQDFEEDAFLAPSGFTETDVDGLVANTDQDDWRIAPAYTGLLRVSPAFPNPAGAVTINIPVNVFQFNRIAGGLALRTSDASGRLITLDTIPEAASPGGYVFAFSSLLLQPNALQRVFVFDGANRLVSYGDIRVTRTGAR